MPSNLCITMGILHVYHYFHSLLSRWVLDVILSMCQASTFSLSLFNEHLQTIGLCQSSIFERSMVAMMEFYKPYQGHMSARTHVCKAHVCKAHTHIPYWTSSFLMQDCSNPQSLKDLWLIRLHFHLVEKLLQWHIWHYMSVINL